jgi:FkbM family methyltransferase
MRNFRPADTNIPGQEWYYVLDKLRGSVAVDIGAHVGDYSLRLSKRFEKVHAFEPDPTNRYVLETNLRLNKVQNVEVDPRAVSDRSGKAMLRRSSKVRTGSTLASKHYGWVEFDSSVEVETISLDDWYEENNRPLVGFVKIDTEGHEAVVLHGGSKLFRVKKPIVGLEVHGPTEGTEECRCKACSILRSYGYDLETRKPYPNADAHWTLGKSVSRRQTGESINSVS